MSLSRNATFSFGPSSSNNAIADLALANVCQVPPQTSSTRVSAVKHWGKHKGDATSEILRPIWTSARFLFRILGPFLSIDQALVYGKSSDNDAEILGLYMDQMGIGDVRRAERDITALQRLRARILTLIPEVEKDILRYEEDSESIDILSTFLHTAAKAARGDDLSTLKNRIILYLLGQHSHAPPAGIEPIRIETTKDGYGWNHLQTGRMLCPAELLAEFDTDPPSFCRAVKDGKRAILGDDFPVFLYKGYTYDPENADFGLLRGELLIQAARGLLTGPRSARKATKGQAEGSGRSSLADKYKLKTITAETIGYVAVLTRFTLSSAVTWTDKAVDGTFHYRKFFDAIVGLFEDTSDPWCAETLQHWKDWVLDSEEDELESSLPLHETAATKFAKQRAARLARQSPY